MKPRPSGAMEMVGSVVSLPFTTDLNAASRMLDEVKQRGLESEYLPALERLLGYRHVGGLFGVDTEAEWALICATADQQCEAVWRMAQQQ